MAEIRPQLQKQSFSNSFALPVDVEINYWTGDRRRRDAPGIIDALWHLLERCGVVSDDAHLGGFERSIVYKNCGLDKANPRVEITIA